MALLSPTSGHGWGKKVIKPVGILALVVFLLLAGLSPAPVQAQSGLTVSESSAEAQFPLSLSFHLAAKSDVAISDVRLHYAVDRESYAQVTSEVYLEFVPASAVDVRWNWDMRKSGGLPPGSIVVYWWTVRDIKGEKVATEPVKVQFNDTRYPWQRLTEGKVTLYWYGGEASFAPEIMLTAQQALTELAEDTGASLKRPVRIYVYANAQDLQGAMVFPQEWTGGVAFTRYGVVAIGIAPSNLSWGKRAVAHELTHLVVGQVTFNPYSELPTWLDEGLAMYAEGALEAEYVAYLKGAIDNGGLISVRSLASPFSAYAREASLAYAQSYSLVEFLITNFGQAKMLELLNTFSQGSSYDEALGKVYGFDMDGLDVRWQDYAVRRYQKVGAKVTALSPARIGQFYDLGLTMQIWARRPVGEKVLHDS